MRDYTGKADKAGNNKRRIKQYGEILKWKRKVMMQKMVTVNSRKYNVEFVIKSMIFTVAVCSRIKHLRRGVKYCRRKSCAMDAIYQCRKITIQKHVRNINEHAITCMIRKQSHPTSLHGYLPRKKYSKVPNDAKDSVPPVCNKKLMT